MLERVSALAGITPYEGDGIRIAENAAFTLTQVSGAAKALKATLGVLPGAVGTTVSIDSTTVLRTGPAQIWLIEKGSNSRTPSSPRKRGPNFSASELRSKLDSRFRGNDGLGDIFVTSLSSSRTCIALEGIRSRDVLAKCAVIDCHPKTFKPNHFAMTGIHHMPVLIHCNGADEFHICIMRTFALSLWEVLVDAGHS